VGRPSLGIADLLNRNPCGHSAKRSTTERHVKTTDVETACLEGNGEISFVKKSPDSGARASIAARKRLSLRY